MPILDQFANIRHLLVQTADQIPPEKRTIIPAGFNNHILWNLGHVAVTEQLLVYGLSGLPKSIDDETIADFRKGSSPRNWTKTYEWETIRTWLLEQPQALKADVEVGIFKTYKEYKTSTGLVLQSASDAISYNLYHEGVHFGYILAMKKSL